MAAYLPSYRYDPVLDIPVRKASWRRKANLMELLNFMTTTTAPGGIQDILVDNGASATGPGQFVTVHHTGRLESGVEFDSSRGRTLFGFPLGVGFVIPGRDQGLVGLRVGGRRRRTIVPELGDGVNGMGSLIPPNAILIFRDRDVREQ